MQAIRYKHLFTGDSNQGMTPKARLIQQVKVLCRKHGVETVAAKARISADNLRQIIAGTKLQSGEPRGVGPTLQRKLEAAFPNWADHALTPPPAAPSPRFEDRHEVEASDWATLQAAKATMTEAEIAAMKTRWLQSLEQAKQQLIEAGFTLPSKAKP